MKNLIVVFILLFLFTPSVFTQVNKLKTDSVTNKIDFRYGSGAFALTDNYISNEKYNGPVNAFNIGWQRWHKTYHYQLSAQYLGSDKIKNNNVSTNIAELSINQAFLYPVKSFSFYNRPLNIFVGPGTEIYIISNDQQIAVAGFDFSFSYAMLFSIGVYTRAEYPLSESIKIISSIKSNFSSLGIRMVDSEDDDETPASLLSALTANHIIFNSGIEYQPFRHFSLSLKYQFNYLYLKHWDAIYTASDNLIAGLAIHF